MEEVQPPSDARRDAARRCEEERQRLLENLAALAWRRPWAPAAIQRARATWRPSERTRRSGSGASPMLKLR